MDEVKPQLLHVFAITACAAILAGCHPEESHPDKTSPPEQSRVKSTDVEGYYVLMDSTFYGMKTMQEVPPGQVLHLGIKGGKWMMINMLSGWGGDYAVDGSAVTFHSTMGPAGPINPRETFTVERTEQGVVMHVRPPKGETRSLTFVRQGDSLPAGFDFDKFLETDKKGKK